MHKRFIQFFGLFLFGLLPIKAAFAGAASVSEPRSYLPTIELAPELGLVDQDGRSVHWVDLRGEVVLLSFVYTSCPGACPMVVHKYGQLRNALTRRGWLGSRVRLMLVTLDPEKDTPAALREFAAQWKVRGSQWLFLTGSTTQVSQTLDRYHIWRQRRPDGVIDHVLRIYLIDGQGRVREIYNTSFFSLDTALEDIQSLFLPESSR